MMEKPSRVLEQVKHTPNDLALAMLSDAESTL